MSQILDQAEVDALLKGIGGGEIETEQGVAPEEGVETTVYHKEKIPMLEAKLLNLDHNAASLKGSANPS